MIGTVDNVSIGGTLRVLAGDHGRPSRLSRPQHRLTSGIAAGTVAAWVAFLAMLSTEALARGGASSRGLWWCAAGMSRMLPGPVLGSAGLGSVGASVAAGLPMWTLMSIAMMLPGTMPAVQHVAVDGPQRQRGRAISKFLAVYLGVWAAFGAAMLALFAIWAPARTNLAIAGALMIAAGWQLTPPKRRALEVCRSSRLLSGEPGVAASVTRFGLRNGTACVGSCWALMLVMALAASQRLLWTVALACIVSAEKLTRAPRHATAYAAGFLACTGLGVAILAVVG